MIYFDHNATSPMLPQARQAWLEAVQNFPGNPSSPHRIGARADAALSQARESLARFFGCDALDIVWTSGATESNNLAWHHLARSGNSAGEVWISSLEHPSMLEPARHFFGKRLRLIPSRPSGVVDLDWMEEQASKRRPHGIAVMAANNETGVLQPWNELLQFSRSHECLFFCDATQWIGKLPAAGLGACDFVSGSAHKFGGPRGVGFLKCPATGPIEPLFRGGPQEEGRRAGTENVPGVLSMMAAIEIRETMMASNSLSQKLSMRRAFEIALAKRVPGTEVVGAASHRLWNTVSALMPEADCQQRWVVKLDKLGFAVSTGSACASGKEEPSHVLQAMGYSKAQSGRVLRFSSGWETERSDWESLLEALEKLAGKQRRPY
ncbi:MAG: cysteine desulfurase family protein [Verrucomicrobiota bacterium]